MILEFSTNILKFWVVRVHCTYYHFGEWNNGIERLLAAAVNDDAPRMRALLGARSTRDSDGRCA